MHYKTLKSISEGEYKEKGSKFIGIAVACHEEEDAKNILNDWRNSNRKAQHLCYAYRLGTGEQKNERVSDDGEPTNSAGFPILRQIQSYDLTNVLIGVVRYYGGIKLGVGGLINAYRTASKLAIENGIIIEKTIKNKLEIWFDYEEMPLIMDLIKMSKAEIIKRKLEDTCSLTIKAELDYTNLLLDKLEKFNSLKIKNIETI